jgi:hypothetical protein
LGPAVEEFFGPGFGPPGWSMRVMYPVNKAAIPGETEPDHCPEIAEVMQ